MKQTWDLKCYYDSRATSKAWFDCLFCFVLCKDAQLGIFLGHPTLIMLTHERISGERIILKKCSVVILC